MSTQAQDRFNAAGGLFLQATATESPAGVASVAGMARAAFERAEEINRQLFAEIQIRVSKDDATAALLAGSQQVVTQLQETVRVMLETLDNLAPIVRRLSELQEFNAKQGGH